MGAFGYELDITRFSAAEREQVKQHIALYKQLRPTIQLGNFHRLLTPFAGTKNETAWEFISADGRQVVLTYFKTLAEPASPVRILKLAGLEAEADYKITEYLPAQCTSVDGAGKPQMQVKGQVYGGDELMHSGLTVEKIDTDFAAYLWVFNKI